MNITKKIVLTLAALTVASFPLLTEGCDGHANHHHQHAHDDHHLRNAEKDCSEDNSEDNVPVGFSTSVVDRNLQSVIRCATAEPDEELLSRMPGILTRWAGSNRRLETDIINIPVYFHIITETDGSGGEVTDLQIENQMKKLNEAYNETFFFTRMDTETKPNSAWYTGISGSSESLEMKTALKVGGTDTLNIYTLAPSDGALGWVSCVISCLGLSFHVVCSGLSLQ
jgi:hypothetical protein